MPLAIAVSQSAMDKFRKSQTNPLFSRQTSPNPIFSRQTSPLLTPNPDSFSYSDANRGIGAPKRLSKEREGVQQLPLSGQRLTVETLRDEFIKFEQRLLPHLQTMMKEHQITKGPPKYSAFAKGSGDANFPCAKKLAVGDASKPSQEAKPDAAANGSGEDPEFFRHVSDFAKAGEQAQELSPKQDVDLALTANGQLDATSHKNPGTLVQCPALPEDLPLGQVEDCTIPFWGPCPARPRSPGRELKVKSLKRSDTTDAYSMQFDDHLSDEDAEHVQEQPDFSTAETAQEFVTAFVLHHNFNIFISGLIVLNCFLIGWEVDYAAKNHGEKLPSLSRAADAIFCVFFLIELMLRIFAHRSRFLVMPGWQWNVFDSIVVILQVLDTAPALLKWTRLKLNLTFIRVFRIIRITRIMRVMRLLNQIKDLRMLVVTIMGSLRTLCWVLLLLFLVLYAFSVFLTTLVTEQLEGLRTPKDSRNVATLQSMFGSLAATMLTLYQAICNGISWRTAVHPLQEENASSLLPLAFGAYMAIMVFALLNVITGVVLTSSVQAAEDDRQQSIVDQMKEFFRDRDHNEVGTICLDEFDNYLHEPALQAGLNAIGISMDDARHLFQLLADVSKSNRVVPEQFIEASIRWCAPAKKIDYAFLQREILMMSNELKDEMYTVNEMSSILKSEVKAINLLSTEIHDEIQAVNHFFSEMQHQQFKVALHNSAP